MDDNSDETEGRRLYRARADTLANAQVAYGKRRVAEVRPVKKIKRTSRKETK